MKAFTAYTAGCFSPNGTSIEEDGTIRHKQNLTYISQLAAQETWAFWQTGGD